jgi:nucleoside-diphosphate-sugar epimerase
MNLFITGASGFVGEHLVEALSNEPSVHNIFALYRKKEQIPFLPKVNPVLSDLNSLPELNINAKIDMLIHLAGYYKTESQTLCDEINVNGTKNAIAMCKNNDINRILFFSTINVDLNTKGCYANSKLIAEKEVKNSGLEYMIVRPSLIFNGREGAIGKIINYTEKLPVVPVFGSGKAKEQPIHITELIDLTIAMIKDFKQGKTIYASGKEPMSFKEMVKIIARCIGKKARVLPIPAKPVRGILKLIEKLGIYMAISSEQVSHMSEDLAADMGETLKLYPINMKPFEEHIKEILANTDEAGYV